MNLCEAKSKAGQETEHPLLQSNKHKPVEILSLCELTDNYLALIITQHESLLSCYELRVFYVGDDSKEEEEEEEDSGNSNSNSNLTTRLFLKLCYKTLLASAVSAMTLITSGDDQDHRKTLAAILLCTYDGQLQWLDFQCPPLPQPTEQSSIIIPLSLPKELPENMDFFLFRCVVCFFNNSSDFFPYSF